MRRGIGDMSHTTKILQAMKPGCIYRPCDLGHLGIDVGTVATILKHLVHGELVDCIDGEEFKRKKMYKTKQSDLFEAPPQSLLDSCKSG